MTFLFQLRFQKTGGLPSGDIMTTMTNERRYEAEVGRIQDGTQARLRAALDETNADLAELGLRTDRKAEQQHRLIPVTSPSQILVPYTSPWDAVNLSRHLAEADNTAVESYLKNATPEQLYGAFLRGKLQHLSLRRANFPGTPEAEALSIHHSINGLFGDQEPDYGELLAYPRITTNIVADLSNFLALSGGRFDWLAKWVRQNEASYLSEMFPDKVVKPDSVDTTYHNPFYHVLRAIFDRTHLFRRTSANPTFVSGLGLLTTAVLAASEKLSDADYGLAIPKDLREVADRLARQIENNLPDKRRWPQMARRSAELMKDLIEERDGLDYIIGDPTQSLGGSLEYIRRQRERDAPVLYVDASTLGALGDAARRKPAFMRSAKSAFVVGDGDAERLFYRNMANVPVEIEPAEIVVDVNPAPAPGYRDIEITQTIPRDVVIIPLGTSDLARAASLAVTYSTLANGSMVSVVKPDEVVYTTSRDEAEQHILNPVEGEVSYGDLESGLAGSRRPLNVVIVTENGGQHLVEYLAGRIRPHDRISVVYAGRTSGDLPGSQNIRTYKLENLDGLRSLSI